MSAEYTEHDGMTRPMFRKPFAYYSDAYRVVMNIALDFLWFGRNERLCRVATNLQNFFTPIPQDNFRAYQLDGTPPEEPAMHPVAITAVLAAGSVASVSEYAEAWLRRFWNEPLRRGPRRYYDNCLYFFSLLMLAGMYRIY